MNEVLLYFTRDHYKNVDLNWIDFVVCMLQFVDRVLVYARGGKGGQALLQIGGLGGDGGDVDVVCKKDATLSHLARLPSRRFVAPAGEDSRRSRVHGKKGANISISVPPGTVVLRAENKTQVCNVGGIDCGGCGRCVCVGGRSSNSWQSSTTSPGRRRRKSGHTQRVWSVRH